MGTSIDPLQIQFESAPPLKEEIAQDSYSPNPSAIASKDPYPAAVVQLSDTQLESLKVFVDEWLQSLKSSQQPLLSEWSFQEEQYRARSMGPQTVPFVGACGDVVPVVAMAVDPVHARLDTGIFKADPVFVLKALKKKMLDYTQ